MYNFFTSCCVNSIVQPWSFHFVINVHFVDAFVYLAHCFVDNFLVLHVSLPDEEYILQVGSKGWVFAVKIPPCICIDLLARPQIL